MSVYWVCITGPSPIYQPNDLRTSSPNSNTEKSIIAYKSYYKKVIKVLKSYIT